MGISVIISSHNSARHIERVLESVKNFDEVVVCDMNSTDRTRAILAAKNVKVVPLPEYDEGGYNAIRRYALENATSEWVLMLRPDEVVTPHLTKYLYEFIKDPGDVRGIIIPRKNYLFNRLRDNTYPDYQFRFFHREGTEWATSKYADPNVSKKSYKIPASKGELALIKLPRSLSTMLHTAHHTHDHHDRAFHSHDRISAWKMIKVPVAKFLKEYLLKGKIRYGTEGYVTSVNKALELYCKMAKAHEAKSMKDFYELLDNIIAGKADPIVPKVTDEKREGKNTDD